jgi:hypothetical protein
VVSITRADDDPTNALSVDFTATFSEEVSPVGPDDFTLATTGVTDAEITDVTGSGDTYSVTVDTGSGDGTIRLDVDEDNSIADAAGNALDPPGFTEGEIYTIDKTEPTSAAVTHPADSISYNAAAYLAGCDDAVEEICGTAADNEGGSGLDVVEVSIQRNSDGFYWDGDAFLDTAGIPIFDEAAGTASWTYAIALPADGVYTVTARATDRAGNTLTGASNTFAVDTTAPETTIGAGAPASGTTSTSASFNFSASEQGSTFECSLDGAPYAACTSPKEYTGLAAGAHEFRVRAKDANGNVDSTPATHSWTIQALNCGNPVTAAAIRLPTSYGWCLEIRVAEGHTANELVRTRPCAEFLDDLRLLGMQPSVLVIEGDL